MAMDPPEEGEEKCATCRMCTAQDKCTRLLSARVDNADLNIKQGDRVEIEISHPSLYMPIFRVLLIPLIGIVTGGTAGILLGRNTEAQEMIAAILGLAGGAVFFCMGQLVLREDKHFASRSAKISRVL